MYFCMFMWFCQVFVGGRGLRTSVSILPAPLRTVAHRIIIRKGVSGCSMVVLVSILSFVVVVGGVADSLETYMIVLDRMDEFTSFGQRQHH